MAGDAGEHRFGGAGRDLALPDLEVATISGDIDRHETNAAGIALRVPLHVEGGCTLHVVAQRGDGDGGDGRFGVQRHGDRRAVDRRRVVEQDARLRADLRVARGAGRGRHGKADEAALRRALARDWCEQRVCHVLHHFAGVGIDRLDQPGGDAGGFIDARADAQDVALGRGEIEIALEVSAVGGHVDIDVADLQITQAQAAWIEMGIELGDEADLAHARAAGVAEGEAVGQGRGGGHEDATVAGHCAALRTLHANRRRGRALLLRDELQVLREV